MTSVANKYNNKHTCLIGDSMNDFEAADVNDIAFYGFNNLSLIEIGHGYINSFTKFISN